MQNELNNAFAKLNEEIATRQMAWAEARRNAVKAKAEELAPMRRQMGEWAYYDKMFAVAGGKTWYAILTQYDWAVLVRKNTEALIAKRDANITKALKKVGITEIPAFELVHNSDGVEGMFMVAGKTVTIRTVLAGGYNIQCLHVRTLVKVK